MAAPKMILACLGLLVPAALAGVMAVAAHKPSASPRETRIVRPVPPAAALPAKSATVVPPKAAAGPYVVRRILDVPGVMKIGDTYWDDKGVPDGPVVITVDLQAKVLSIFRSGYEIGTAAILYGGDDKPTPLGVFPITQKHADHVSNLYGAPMPYMMRLTNDGISIHGTVMERGMMTHGCVGVPTAFARKLFRAAKLGDKVIVTDGERLDIGKPITAA
jgi:hypothetical protein